MTNIWWVSRTVCPPDTGQHLLTKGLPSNLPRPTANNPTFKGGPLPTHYTLKIDSSSNFPKLLTFLHQVLFLGSKLQSLQKNSLMWREWLTITTSCQKIGIQGQQKQFWIFPYSLSTFIHQTNITVVNDNETWSKFLTKTTCSQQSDVTLRLCLYISQLSSWSVATAAGESSDFSLLAQ